MERICLIFWFLFQDSELEGIDEAKTYGNFRRHSLVPLDKLLETDEVKNGTFNVLSY